jgi:4-diphosphocytidyl-2-C-methyl-D-erythritol kinase
MTFSLPAPAKLNLFLHITGRRADGYHTLQTVFALLDVADALHFSAANHLTLDAPAALGGDDNLVLRAARALQHATGCQQGASLKLDKTLPAGGGVGGGSSDAATTLLGLNHLWQLGLTIDQLAHIGLTLGADVPVFVRGHSAWADGIGEQLQPIDLTEEFFLVVHPGISVSTAAIFNDPQLTRHTPESRVAAFLGPGAETRFRNDCEPVATRLFPEVGAAIRWLQKHAGNGRMTGTGACVFARVADRQQGDALGRQLPPQWQGFVARSVNVSPAHTALAALRETAS